jgi:hypothetical protein
MSLWSPVIKRNKTMAYLTAARLAVKAAPLAFKLAKSGYKAYKLGKKTRKATKLAKSAKTAVKLTKKYNRVSKVAQKGTLKATLTLRPKTATRLMNLSDKAKGVAARQNSKATKLLAQKKAVNKVKASGSKLQKVSLAAGQNSRAIKAGAAIGAGGVAAKKLSNKKRKPMTAAHKKAISDALKGKKRR